MMIFIDVLPSPMIGKSFLFLVKPAAKEDERFVRGSAMSIIFMDATRWATVASLHSSVPPNNLLQYLGSVACDSA